MIVTMDFKKSGESIFSYEFLLPSANYVVGVPWAQGMTDGINEFKRAHLGHSLFGVTISLGTRP